MKMAMFAQVSDKIRDFFTTGDLMRESFYIDKEDVLKELERRQSLYIDDESLLAMIKPTPSIQRLLEKPHLIFPRHIATPLHETLRAIEVSKELGLGFCVFEYTNDSFVYFHNQFKYGLAKMPIYEKTNNLGEDIFHYTKIVEMHHYTGKPLSSVKTKKGESLVDFHHELFTEVTGIDYNSVVIDISEWVKQFNSSAVEYYEPLFALLLKHNVLTEVFYEGQDDKDGFTNFVARPAFNNIHYKFGFKPMILNSQPLLEQDRFYWDCYPKVVNDLIEKKGYIEK